MELQDIQQEMQKCKKYDPAKAHVKADALLSELATLLASRIDVETQQKTQQIIQTYDKIKKWYA